jgi:hypothetical protein
MKENQKRIACKSERQLGAHFPGQQKRNGGKDFFQLIAYSWSNMHSNSPARSDLVQSEGSSLIT